MNHRMSSPVAKSAPTAPRLRLEWGSLILSPLTRFTEFWSVLFKAPPNELASAKGQALKALAVVTSVAVLIHCVRFHLAGFGGGFIGWFFVITLAAISSVLWTAVLYVRLFLLLALLESITPAIARLKSERLFLGLLVPFSLPQVLAFTLFSPPSADREVWLAYGLPTAISCYLLWTTLQKLMAATKQPMSGTLVAAFWIISTALVYFSEYLMKVWVYSLQIHNSIPLPI
jgi:hypothetical protein